jgi:pyruvate/2-oxoglutarate dehydrogenase complex dihydrolipoamide acyltransferase (E2) component
MRSGGTDEPTRAANSGDVRACCDAGVDLEVLIAVGLDAADRVAPEEERATALAEWNATVRQQLNVMRDDAPEDEPHEIFLARLDDDVTMSVDHVMAAPEEQASTMITRRPCPATPRPRSSAWPRGPTASPASSPRGRRRRTERAVDHPPHPGHGRGVHRRMSWLC